MEIKAIETYYDGRRFRSRLEARWAVFFNMLGVKYEYEPEGFDLGGGLYYLPDFRVQCYGCRGDCDRKPFDLYIEVKGKMSEEDAKKINLFAGQIDPVGGFRDVQNSLLIVDQIPDKGEAADYSLGDRDIGYGICPFNYATIDGDWFGAYPAATKDGKFYLFGADSNYINWDDLERVEKAYEAARCARFEHGETPPTRKMPTRW